MGSKSPEHDGHRGNDAPTCSINGDKAGGEPRGAHLSRDGDSSLGDEGGDDDDDDEGAATADVKNQAGDGTEKATAQSTGESASKKKKRKKSKKKTSTSKQSSPPRVPLSDLFPKGQYPTGEFMSYEPAVENTARTTAEETRYLSRHDLYDETFFNNYRKAAEIHRQVRHWTQETARPGTSLTDIAVGIDDGVRALLDNAGLEPGSGLKSGLGFPTGLSLNNCVAHWTPNPGQKDVILDKTDVMKVDFGVHIDGWIVDSAFTMSFDPTYDSLLAAVKDSTNTGIKNAGVDVRISDVSAAIQEVMESYEVEIGGKTFPVKPVRNITGHNIKAYQIHAGKSVPFIKTKDQTKMEEGEVFAIETFGTTGRGMVYDGPGVYGYGKSYSAPSKISSSLASARSLYKTINDNFGTIVFSRRSLERLGVQRYLAGMNDLANKGVVEVYEPLLDIPGSYSAQFEHTILLGETSKEVISRGNDY